MSKVLKNLQLTFGETAASPKVLPIASVNTLIKAIEDPEVTTRFSGHIMSETGSINAAQAYTLSLAGLTFHGNIDPVDFTLKSNKTEIVDNNEVLFTTTGVPVSAINFIVDNVVINNGSLTVEDVKNICRIEGNKLIVAPAGVTFDWQATITVKAITKYTPATEKTISIVVKHIAYSAIVVQNSINFDTPNTVTIPISFTPVTANVPIDSIRAELENLSAIYEVGISNNNLLITCKSVTDFVTNKVNIEATDISGKVIKGSVNITNKVLTIPSIAGDNSFIAKNGIGSGRFTFVFTPAEYNVPVEFVSVISSNNLIAVSNASIEGFILSVAGISADISSTITAKIKVDGVEKTATKTITATYKQVFNEFKVYANSAWVVPNSNVDIKVGDVVAEYIGDGLWTVDDALVDESMDVTAGGVVLGKYGKNEYSDGSEIGNEQLSSRASYLNLPIGTIITYYYIYRSMLDSDTIAIKDGTNTIISQYFSSNTTNDSGSVNNYKITNGSIAINHGLNSFNVTFQLIYKLQTFSVLTPDLSLSSTSLTAKNGTLNEEITPTISNGGTIVLQSVSSSNTAITAAIEDGKIKLTGEIADGNPQTSKLTIYYTVNGYNRSVEVDVTATYQEVEEEYEAIDLGLPSGIRWANRNVGAKKPSDKGLYFQWGSINGHEEGEGYSFSSNNYPESGISANLSLSQDAANAIMGGDWRMPTKEEFKELYDNTTWTWTSQGGIDGYLVTSKTNANSIFFPTAGLGMFTSIDSVGSYGAYWSRSFNNKSDTYFLSLSRSFVNPQNSHFRYYGMPVRAVL